ncbi:hypothetical protein BVRB_2g039180 [Beta vulgaris subsp. vulgaris]|nr:hypothetical protein BVRB_2g039180 [Beta vulgaris subsp. vulgaris]
MSESEPSSPSLDGGKSSSVSSPRDERTRLLADLPLMADMAKELRSKFLNERSTPEQENMTIQYLSARMSGDNQTLRELRHHILARKVVRNPPPNVVPGLDVQHLRKHAWLDSLADAELTVPADFPLRRHFTKSYPRMEDVPSYGLSRAKQEAFDYFESEADAGGDEESEARIPCTWLPHAKYILGNEPLYAFYLCRTHPKGAGSLDLGDLGLDENLKSMLETPEDPIFVYDTVHDLTGGPQGADRNAGRGSRTAGREVPLCAAVKATFSGPPTTSGPLYRPNWDVREDESLYADIPANGGTLGYCLLKGLQLPVNCPTDKLVAPAAQLAHDLAVANNCVVELIAQYVEYQRVAESSELVTKDLKAARDAAVSQAEKKKGELELALKAAKEETTAFVKNAKAEVGRLALAAFKKSEEYVGLLGERYDGGWVAVKRCSFAEGAHLRPLTGEPYICFEEVIANILPVAEDEEAPPS